IVRQIVKEGLHAFLIQLFPVSAVSGFFQPIRVEDLLELVAHGHAQVGLAEMQSLGDERKSGIGNDGACTGQIRKESVERRPLLSNVSFLAFASEAVSDERAADRT